MYVFTYYFYLFICDLLHTPDYITETDTMINKR
jgi:hypothetical protein